MGVQYRYPRAVCKIRAATGSLVNLNDHKGSKWGPAQTALSIYRHGVSPTLGDTFQYLTPDGYRGWFSWGVSGFVLGLAGRNTDDPSPEDLAFAPVKEKIDYLINLLGLFNVMPFLNLVPLPDREALYQKLIALPEKEQGAIAEAMQDQYAGRKVNRAREILGL